MKTLFFITFAVYAVSVILEFTGTAFKKDKLLRAAWLVFIAAAVLHTVFLVARGVAAKRLPLSNQFEFSNAFAWGVALFTVAVCTRMKTEWLKVIAMPAALLIIIGLIFAEIHAVNGQFITGAFRRGVEEKRAQAFEGTF